MKTFALHTFKGGVGKTSAAVNLAHLSAGQGRKTLLWDLDPQGAASYLYTVRQKVKGGGKALIEGSKTMDDAIRSTEFDKLDMIPADFSYRSMDRELDAAKKPTRRVERLLGQLGDDYDVVIIDCPPSTSLLAENIIQAADTLVVPMIPSTLSLRSFDQLTDFVTSFDGNKPRIVGFFSMVDRRKRLHRDLVAQLPTEFPTISTVTIGNLSAIEQMAEHRVPVTASAPRGPAARAYAALWTDILARSRH